MPTKTKTKTRAVNRRTNTKKRTQRSWAWWMLFVIPIIVSVGLFAEPLLNEAKIVLESAPMIEGVLDNGVKEDVDWIMSHLYKVFPLVLSLIAIFKKNTILGRSK